MRFINFVLSSAVTSVAIAAPFAYPLANGFPNLNATALQQVYKLAGGTLPNGALPSKLLPAGVQTLQLIAANELFETAYFTELLANITTGVSGYEDGNTQAVKDALTAIINQETLHALSVNAVLSNANATAIQPCQYSFPVDNYADAILLAQTFTDVVLGVLPLAQAQFAADGGQEVGLIPIIGSVIGQEGEQVGWFRHEQGKIPSAAPFLTGGAPQFAYTAVSNFIVPGSCPNINVIGLTATPALTVENIPKPDNGTILFSVNGTVAANASVAYISGQNLPVVVPITGSAVNNNRTYFFASFPYDAGFNRGLTLGALVKGGAVLNTSAAVANATIAGPALIELD